MGIEVFRPFKVREASVPVVTTTSTFRPISSEANSGKRST
jgi:hypothetical protein